MRQREPAFGIFHDQRLAILQRGRAGGGIPIMADGAGTLQLLDHFGVEDVCDQSHPAMGNQNLAIRRDDSG